MTYRTPLEEVSGCRDNLDEARSMTRACEQTLQGAIRRAIEAGEAVPEIAKAARMSRERVYQIRDGRR